MARYVAIVDGEPGSFGISFPDAPGCVAMDTTIEGVIAAGGEVLAEWVGDVMAAGRPVPKASTADKIRKDREIKELLENGGLLVSIPLVLDAGRSARANISLDTGLLAAIDEAARRQKVTRSAFLAAAARDKIKATA